MTHASFERITKGNVFRALHAKKGKPLLMPNPWDACSARLLQAEGFEALATSSAAAAWATGHRDGRLPRREAIAHAGLIASAVEIPVSADLENGFGDSPERVAETIRMAAEAGLAGGSIEDATGDSSLPIFPLGLAVERIQAAVAAAGSLGAPFVLTARAENFIKGRTDLDDTIARLAAYESAGADVLFAPGLPTLEAVREVVQALKKPVSFMVGPGYASFSVEALATIGIARISFGTCLYRVAATAIRDAAREIRGRGTFGFMDGVMPYAEIQPLVDT